MDRTVPRTGSEEIELYIRTYYSLLRSTTDVQIRTLEEAHANMGSSLHPRAHSTFPDMSAFIYSALRLPACITAVDRIVLGQSQRVFSEHGFGEVEAWRPVAAPSRRRRLFFDGQATLAAYIGSRSDIDDMLPIITAFQIEWNKLHRLLKDKDVQARLENLGRAADGLPDLSDRLGVEVEDLRRLMQVWGEGFLPALRTIAAKEKRLQVGLLAGSLNDYRRATQMWWEAVEAREPSVRSRPVYFVSSNTHSLANLLTGFALERENELVELLESLDEELKAEWQRIESGHVPSSRENFLYFLAKEAVDLREGRWLAEERAAAERACGITRVPSEHSFEVEVQIIDLTRLDPDRMDPRLTREDLTHLRESRALIVNIDYPLGMAAYEILSHVATRVGKILGIYIMGKAATLNGVIGDVMIPSVVHDEQSQNTYLFENCFTAADVSDSIVYGTVLDNQKAVTVRGTFLQTPQYMEVFYREGYTDIEMEAGPYLSAIYELHRPKLHPNNEIVNLYGLPFDLGILHYASDTPRSKGKNLGAGSLAYFGMDATYASSLAILQRILTLERQKAAGRREASSLSEVA